MAQTTDPRWQAAASMWNGSKAQENAAAAAGLAVVARQAEPAVKPGGAGIPDFNGQELGAPHPQLDRDARTFAPAPRYQMPGFVGGTEERRARGLQYQRIEDIELDYPSMTPDPVTGMVDGRGPGRGTAEERAAYFATLAQAGLGGPSVGGQMVVDFTRDRTVYASGNRPVSPNPSQPGTGRSDSGQ